MICRRIVEPHFALDEGAHGIGMPTEAKHAQSAHRRSFAQHGHTDRLLQLRKHVQRGLRPALLDFDAREQRDRELLLIASRLRCARR